jgi:hypothetical protein
LGHNHQKASTEQIKMSEWVVLDITAFTKTTKTEKVQKILKTVSVSLVYDGIIVNFKPAGWCCLLQDNGLLPERVQEQAHHLHHCEEG